jgi:hypothetical protein
LCAFGCNEPCEGGPELRARELSGCVVVLDDDLCEPSLLRIVNASVANVDRPQLTAVLEDVSNALVRQREPEDDARGGVLAHLRCGCGEERRDLGRERDERVEGAPAAPPVVRECADCDDR